MSTNPSKETILSAISAFARQRPGLDFANYGDRKPYFAEVRAITRDLHDYRALLAEIDRCPSVTAEMLLAAAKSAYAGRLSMTADDSGAVAVSYCAGQYWPTEYRKAACAVLAAALWARKRESCMPADLGKVSPGEWLRKSFRQDFGRGIASRWFN